MLVATKRAGLGVWLSLTLLAACTREPLPAGAAHDAGVPHNPGRDAGPHQGDGDGDGDGVDPGTPHDGGQPRGPYVPPAPVQLTPPPSVIRAPGEPAITYRADRDDVQIAVKGQAYRPMWAKLSGDHGQRTLEIVVDNAGKTLRFADSGFHLTPAGTAHSDGSIMLCWNTLTGTASAYSPNAPDPARGMALSCRLLKDGALSPLERIRVPTVGCWIQRLVAMPDGRFRLLYKGDDGWFEAGSKPDHGVYQAFYEDGQWSTPELLLPVRSIQDP